MVVSVGKSYEVWATATFKKLTYLLVISDSDIPVWLPEWLFDITTPTVPADWEAHGFDGDVASVNGPNFVSRSVEAYVKMVELDPKSVEAFWCRVAAQQAIQGDGPASGEPAP